ncbi:MULTISPECIES: STAS domain-containing protein [unclassified Pseudomonas]|uniref:STAS domain-containing protein n=1 Tax=unclassified Pseudomonas TaxID=196821 RepID=UPI0025F064EC|nr:MULTISPECIES: STAS domain-containing protein [unclassified Pseudomonas]
MSVTSDRSPDEQQLTIKIKGRFDFSTHQDFRKAYEQETKARRYVVDLKDTNYLDSSALGMLLLLRDHAGGDRSIAKVCLTNCNSDVKKILAISNFDKLFDVG